MYAQNEPTKTDYPPAPSGPPLYSDSQPAPIPGQQQETGTAGYPPGQPIYPPLMQQQYPPPMQQQYPPPMQQPITGQPGAGEWMQLQPGHLNPNCPPGLEYLSAIDQLLVHQKIELLEVISGFETANKYTVKNSLGQKVFYAAEKSNCCARQCCGPSRPFEMKIVDNNKQEVIHLNRPLACTSCCYPCCLQHMEVCAPSGNPIGSVQQLWSICKPKFAIKDASGETVLIITGPVCSWSCCKDVNFHVYSKDGTTKVGKISKQWGGFAREAFTDADNFGINFPLDLDVKIKAVLLGACFLIEFMYFENGKKK